MKKGQNFYRRDPSKALSGMIGLSLEERGVYNTVLDLLYSTWRPLEDDRAFLANWCGCAVQKLNPIVRRLIEKGRLITFEEGGRTYLSDEAFEEERATVKGTSQTRSGRGQIGEKSEEVEEKSAGVRANPGLLGTTHAANQALTGLEKNREEKSTPLPPKGEPRRKPRRPIPDDFPTDELIAAMQEEARQAGANFDVRRFALRFRGQCEAKDYRYADWAAAWRKWCRDEIDRAPKTAAASLASRQTSTSADDRWRRWVREFKANKYWPTDDAGPRPGREGCRVPTHILAEFDLATRAANTNTPVQDLFSKGDAA